MKSVVRWAIQNAPAMNILMISALVIGVVSLASMRREVFPEFELEIILVQVPYPSASTEEVEDGICKKVEEAVQGIDGVKKMTSIAKEGVGNIVLELEAGVDAQKILNEVRSEVDRIPSFPLKAEDPEVKQITMRSPAIQVAVVMKNTEDKEAEKKLRAVSELVRDELILLDYVSEAEIQGAKEFQIDVEIPEKILRKHKLSLKTVAEIVREENMELPGGTIKTRAQDILVKGDNKNISGTEISKIVLKRLPNGTQLTIGDLGTVRDQFSDRTSEHRVNGKPAMIIEVSRTSKEDLLAMTDAVRKKAKELKEREDLAGYDILVYDDRSVDVWERMDLLARNGLQGLVLVLIALALFLDTRLAFWVALGIPISILGACAVLYLTGNTLNMLTMFAFLMALGIVVDDAIVVGENIHSHRQMGKGSIKAAVDGTFEVLPSVITSVSTTVIAFMPLFFVTGVMGKFIACLPLAMIAMLVISLLESTFILPCHLAHKEGGKSPLQLLKSWNSGLPGYLRWTLGGPVILIFLLGSFLIYPFLKVVQLFKFLSRSCNNGLQWVATNLYMPALRYALRNPGVIISSALVVLILVLGLVRSGTVPFVVFPKLDSKMIEASITFTDGTPPKVTRNATQLLEQSIRNLDRRFADEGTKLVKLTKTSVGFSKSQSGPGQILTSDGSHIGSITVELTDTADRPVTSNYILKEWRNEWNKLTGNQGFPGVESLKFNSAMMGPGGVPIEFRLLGRAEDFSRLKKAVEECKAKLASYPGVFDINDDSTPGKLEMELKVKKKAKSLGISNAKLAETVRASYYGEEVMRLQRGRHEVKLMVRYPREERRSIANFDQIRVRTDENGPERPITELAEVKTEQRLAEINRVNQLRSITISADVDESRANAHAIVAELRKDFIPELLKKKEFTGLSVMWEGQQQQTVESMQSLFVGFFVAIIIMYVVLTLEFRSYFQALLILAIIPFGAVGAIAGHWLLGLPVTMFSVFGLVALTGVVVNDSIVLIDFINHRVRDGIPLKQALLDAGQRRLRPVFLTSVTTIAGLLPLLTERSFQAQILIPMAVSLCFGLLLTTFLVLFLVPVFYSLYGRIVLATTGTFEDQHDEDEVDMPQEKPIHAHVAGKNGTPLEMQPVGKEQIHEVKSGDLV